MAEVVEFVGGAGAFDAFEAEDWSGVVWLAGGPQGQSEKVASHTDVGEPLELIDAAADEALVEKGPCRLHGGRCVWLCHCVCLWWTRLKLEMVLQLLQLPK